MASTYKTIDNIIDILRKVPNSQQKDRNDKGFGEI